MLPLLNSPPLLPIFPPPEEMPPPLPPPSILAPPPPLLIKTPELLIPPLLPPSTGSLLTPLRIPLDILPFRVLPDDPVEKPSGIVIFEDPMLHSMRYY